MDYLTPLMFQQAPSQAPNQAPVLDPIYIAEEEPDEITIEELKEQEIYQLPYEPYYERARQRETHERGRFSTPIRFIPIHSPRPRWNNHAVNPIYYI